ASAGKKIEKDTARKSGRGKTALVWTLVIGSAAGVGYYVWKKAQPVEDPWSTPLPHHRPADARPVGSTPASRQSTAPQVSQTAVPEPKSEDETPAPKTAVKPAEVQDGQADAAKPGANPSSCAEAAHRKAGPAGRFCARNRIACS